MLRKYGSLAVLDAFQVPATAAPRRLRKLAHRVTFDYEPRPGFLYVRSRAISSRANDNHDEFPAEEIVKAYRSFLGKPVFVNHHNANHRRARGVIVAVALHRDRNPDGTPDTWAEVLQEIDARRFPRLCKAIINGRVNRTSMGVDVEESECSACGNKATDPAQYCHHLPALKGRKIRKRNEKTGKLHEEIIREICRGLSFFENSLLVEDPADPTAYVLGTPDTRGLSMTAAASAPPEEPDFRNARGNHCTTCGRLVRWSNHPTRGGWRHLSAAANYYADHPAAPSNPGDKSSAYPVVFGGTHCAVCHEPVQISLDHLHVGGGWSHHDGMKRDHPATPADPQGVYDSIPAQRAAYQQARGHVEDTLAQQGLPRRMPPGMPLDPFQSARNVPYEEELPGFPSRPPRCINCGHRLQNPSQPGSRMGNWPSKVPQVCNDCYIGHVGSPSERGKGRELAYEDKGGMGSRQVSERFMQSPLSDDPFETFRGPNPIEHRSWHPEDALKHSLSHRKTAITGEEAEPGHSIWARPQGGESPVAEEVYQNAHSREPGEHGINWYKGISYHGPYHLVRHPETRETHVLDAQGRDAGWRGRSYGNHEKQGWHGEEAAERHWIGLESVGPDAERTRSDLGYANHDLMKERTPAFPHSRIDPEDVQRAQRPDARVHKPEGYNPEDEWHGPYEVVKHPETGKFHVIDNAGRHAPGMGSWQGHPTQLAAERSRDYIDKRQQSKERGAQIAKSLFEGFTQIMDPGSTPESRESDRHLRTGQELMTRYAGGRGKIKFDPDDEGGAPYYHREHYLPNGNRSGWYVKHYGGAHAGIYHHGTGEDVAHEEIRFPEHPDEREHPYELHPDFDDISLGKALKDWHDEEGGTRHYYERDKHGIQNEPKISRWKRRWPNGQPEPRSKPGGFMPEGSVRFEALQKYHKAEDHPWFQANHVSSDNIVAAYHDSTSDEQNLGHRWYEDAHHIAKAIAGGDIARGAGLLAAYSPRTPWPVNMMNASKAHRTNRAFGGPGEGAMGLHRDLAAPIIAGIHHSAAFKKSAPKIGDFAHLVEHGGDSEDERKAGKTRVVIDRHALSAAIGRRVNTQDVQDAPLGNRMMYDHVADAFRHAAERLTKEQGRYIAPHQVQATVWLRQLRVNQAEDDQKTTWQGGGRGRVVRNKNAWQRWHDQAHQHHPEIHPSNQHIHADPSGVIEPVQHKHASRRRLAYGETKMPPQINTLRQEECPVCGEAQVWTGQRCPVCGYVSPPDLFRDPDTSKAMQVREELDQEGDVDIPPEGQGSWPAADEQLYHPDQIAPNGVPSAGPGVPGTDEGTQLEQADEDELPELVCPACGAQFGADEAEEGQPCPQCGQAPLERDVEPGVEDPDALDDMELEPGAELEDDEQAEAQLAEGEREGPDAEEPVEEEEDDEEPPPRLKSRR